MRSEADVQQPLNQFFHRFGINDSGVVDAQFDHGVADGADSSGGTVHGLDAGQMNAAFASQRDGLVRIIDRGLPVGGPQCAGVEKAFGQDSAAELPTQDATGVGAAAENEFGAAAADVEDAMVLAGQGRGLHHASVDVVAFLLAAQDADRTAQCALAQVLEIVVLLATEGIGSDCGEIGRILSADHLGCLSEAVDSGMLVAFPDLAVLLEAGPERNVLLEFVEHGDVPVLLHAGVDHVKAVGSEIQNAIGGIHRFLHALPSVPPVRRSACAHGR